jgi:hypothetical protein
MIDRSSTKPSDWPPYEVVCAEFDSYGSNQGHRHLRSIETVDQDGGRTRWDVPATLAALRNNERFMVGGERAGATLTVGLCPACPFITLRFEPPEVVIPTCG